MILPNKLVKRQVAIRSSEMLKQKPDKGGHIHDGQSHRVDVASGLWLFQVFRAVQ